MANKFRRVAELLGKAWEQHSDDGYRVAKDALEELSIKPHGNLEVKKGLLKGVKQTGPSSGNAMMENYEKRESRRGGIDFSTRTADPVSRQRRVPPNEHYIERLKKHEAVSGPETAYDKEQGGVWKNLMEDKAYLDKLSDNAIPIAGAGIIGSTLLGSGSAEASTGRKEIEIPEQPSALENMINATGIPTVLNGYGILNKHVIKPHITSTIQKRVGEPSLDAIAAARKRAVGQKDNGSEYLIRAVGSAIAGDKQFEDYAMSDSGRRDVNELETGPLGETGTAFATGIAKYAGEEPFPLAGIGDEDENEAKKLALKKMKDK